MREVMIPGELIGTTRQTVSHLIGQLIRAGTVVRRRRELLIANQRALRQVAELPMSPGSPEAD